MEGPFSIYTLIFKTMPRTTSFFLLTIKFLEDLSTHVTFCAFLTLPSGSSTLYTMESVLTKANEQELRKVTENLFRLYCNWTVLTGLSSSTDVLFHWLLACHSLLVLGLICWPFNHLLNISVLQGSALDPLSSPPWHSSLANTLTPMASTNTT